MGFYVYKSLSINNRFLETVNINNQTILNFVNLWSKKSSVNILFPSTIGQLDGYPDASVSLTYVSYNTSRDKQSNNIRGKERKFKGVVLLR